LYGARHLKSVEAPGSGPRRDWLPTGLALCAWLCALPLVFLLVVPWLGVRAAVIMALGLLPIIAVACRKLCAEGTSLESRRRKGRTESLTERRFIMAKDPVCGMNVDEKKAATTSTHAGKTYYFCSAGCKATFEKAPEKYAVK
jgi:Cu+-exporting ATPase